MTTTGSQVWLYPRVLTAHAQKVPRKSETFRGFISLPRVKTFLSYETCAEMLLVILAFRVAAEGRVETQIGPKTVVYPEEKCKMEEIASAAISLDGLDDAKQAQVHRVH